MRIIQIAPCYVDMNSETGGVANIIRQICLYLEKNKIDTVLICSNTELGKTVAKPGFIKYSDNLSIYIVHQNQNPLLGPKKELLSVLESINDISIVHIHTCFSSITENSLKFFTKKKIPCIFTPHGKLSPTMFNNKGWFKKVYFNFISKKSINLVAKVVTSSINEIKYAQALGIKGQFTNIYNGYTPVDTIKTESIYNSESYILFLGYLDPRKQPDLLIRAYKKSKAVKKFKLILAGPDSYGFQNKLQSLCDSLDLQIGNDVIFTGRVEGQKKWELLRSAKGLFLPSVGEGWPVVIAEAIGAEIPCVISKGCNFSEINSMKLGIEIDDFQIDKWAFAIDEICFNDELSKEYKYNLELYKKSFSWESITSEWIKIYNETVGETLN